MPANPQVTDEMVEKAAMALDPLAFGLPSYMSAEGRKDDARIMARAALEAALADHAVGWRDIESAPDNKSVLLGWFDWRDGQWCAEVGAAITGQRFDNGYSNVSKHGSATHWMPIPAAPLPQKNREDAGT